MNTAPLMILATFRPEFQPPWPERPHLTRIPIPRLSVSEAATMVSLASQGSHLPREMVIQLVNRSDGIPLFVEELARAVMGPGLAKPSPRHSTSCCSPASTGLRAQAKRWRR